MIPGVPSSLVPLCFGGLGYTFVIQEIFGTEPGDLRKVLRDKIDACEGLIQMVGQGYGAEPPTVDADSFRALDISVSIGFGRARTRAERTTLASVMAAGPFRNHEGDDPLVEGLVVCVDEFDQDLVRPRGKTVDDQRLAARVCPAPGRIIHGHMDVPNPRRHIEGVRAEHRYDPQVLGAILDDDPALDQRIRKRRIDDNPRRGLTGERHNGSGSTDVPDGLRHRGRCAQNGCCAANARSSVSVCHNSVNLDISNTYAVGR